MSIRLRTIMLLAAVAAAVVAAGCSDGEPRGIIPADRMADVIYDYQLADGIAQQQGKGVERPGEAEGRTLALQTAALRKHGVTRAEFDSSMVYYLRHADVLRDIYKQVADRMEAQARALGADVDSQPGGSLSGDTLDIWDGQRQLVLLPMQPYNLHTFEVKADTTFHPGDGIVLRFSSTFICQDGTRDAVAMLAVTFANDSTATTVNHISSSSTYTLSLTDGDSLGIRRVRGFFIFNRGSEATTSSTTLRMLSVQGIRLLRRRERPDKAKAGRGDSLSTSPSTRRLPPGTEVPRQPLRPDTAVKMEELRTR